MPTFPFSGKPFLRGIPKRFLESLLRLGAFGPKLSLSIF
jgi:hypothetical protein